MRVNYNTQVEDTTVIMVMKYLEYLKKTEQPMSKAALTDAALREYIEKRLTD